MQEDGCAGGWLCRRMVVQEDGCAGGWLWEAASFRGAPASSRPPPRHSDRVTRRKDRAEGRSCSWDHNVRGRRGTTRFATPCETRKAFPSRSPARTSTRPGCEERLPSGCSRTCSSSISRSVAHGPRAMGASRPPPSREVVPCSLLFFFLSVLLSKFRIFKNSKNKLWL